MSAQRALDLAKGTAMAHGAGQAYSTDARLFHHVPPASITQVPKSTNAFKVHLSSSDANAGSTPTNAVFTVDLTNRVQAGRVKVVVESWTVANTSSGALNNLWYRVRLPELFNRSSYSSANKGFSSLLLSTTGYSYYPREQVGTVVPAADFFATRSLTVTIESPVFAAAGYAWSATDAWDLVLSVVPLDD